MNNIVNEENLDSLTACHDCDLLIEKISLEVDQQAHCPRCNSLMYQGKRNVNLKTMIVSISGLFMVVPAYTLPIMTMQVLGQQHSTSLIQSIPSMLTSSYWLIGIGIILFAMVIPVLILFITFWISIHIQFNQVPKYLASLQKLYQELVSWGMSEVYILGLIVSFVKLIDDFTMTVDVGFVSLAILMFCSLLVTTTTSKRYFWETISAKL